MEEPAADAAPRRSQRLQKTEDIPKVNAGASDKKRAPQPPTKTEPPTKKSRSSKQPTTIKEDSDTVTGKSAKASTKKPKETANVAATKSENGERDYWLMKAEPESRFENGVDVKFSIDDLAAKTEPEPWDGTFALRETMMEQAESATNTSPGIRAYAARNNLRAMKKGDLAFFYHSNCKEPGIVGTMEIVQEHTPDREHTTSLTKTQPPV